MKHAANDQQPLWSAEERVAHAIQNVFGMENVFATQTLSPDQQKWLDLIRRQLIANLAIERADFELLDFERAGGTWHRVDADFGGELESILLQLNEAVAT